MILIIMFALLFIAGIICTRIFWDRVGDEWLPSISLALSFIGGLGLMGCCLFIALCNSPAAHVAARVNYSETVTSLNSTYKLLTQAEDSYAKYTAIQQYNSEVREFKEDITTTQAHLKNPWINWMCNYEYKNFDANVVSYINIE